MLSLGNGFRAGAIDDATDRVQIQELLINCELAQLGREAGCQTMVEGPGHVPINEIEANVIMEKKMSGGSPFYMLGPITTDIAPGHDHITAAVGAALSSSYGADFICYVTPSEHLGLPFAEDVREGVIASRIAAHIGDMIKYKDTSADKAMSKATPRDALGQAARHRHRPREDAGDKGGHGARATIIPVPCAASSALTRSCGGPSSPTWRERIRSSRCRRAGPRRACEHW